MKRNLYALGAGVVQFWAVMVSGLLIAKLWMPFACRHDAWTLGELDRLATLLQEYEDAHDGSLPGTVEELVQWSMRGKSGPEFPLWLEDGRVVDWWGHPIQYFPDRNVKFLSFSQDGGLGGEGTDSDLSTEMTLDDLYERRPTWDQIFHRPAYQNPWNYLFLVSAAGALLTVLVLSRPSNVTSVLTTCVYAVLFGPLSGLFAAGAAASLLPFEILRDLNMFAGMFALVFGVIATGAIVDRLFRISGRGVWHDRVVYAFIYCCTLALSLALCSYTKDGWGGFLGS